MFAVVISQTSPVGAVVWLSALLSTTALFAWGFDRVQQLIGGAK